MNGEQLTTFHSRVDSLKVMIEHKLTPLIAGAALEVARVYHGGAVGLIKHLIENHSDWRKELTAEEVAEFELMEKEEIERDLRDFTPNLNNPIYQGDVWIAQWLLSEATTGGDFDEVFENIMIHRYDKSVQQTVDGETAVYRRVRTLDECEGILI